MEPDERAARLILAVHQSMDWQTWGSKRLKYWQILTDNVRSAAYTNSLVKFVNTLCSRMNLRFLGSTDPHYVTRQQVEEMLRVSPVEERATLRALREQAMTCVLQVRVWIETQREAATGPGEGEEPEGSEGIEETEEPVGLPL